MIEKKFIYVTTSFVSCHCYPNAEGTHSYLKHPHRHIFGVKVKVSVTHNDRDIEFFALKDTINDYLKLYEPSMGSKSCEDVAELLADYLERFYEGKLSYIQTEVNEDGENGAIVERSYE